MTTPNDILRQVDVRVCEGFTRTVHALIAQRDGYVDVERDGFDFEFDTDAGAALSGRISVRVKAEEIVDMGDGRTAIDVVAVDGKPIAIVAEDGYDSFAHDVVVLDMAAVDILVDAVRSLRRPKVDLTEEVGMDEDVSERLRLVPRGVPSP